MVESSDRMWSTGEGNGKPLQYSCLKNPTTVWKGKKIEHWKINSPGLEVPDMLLENSGEITEERMKFSSFHFNHSVMFDSLWPHWTAAHQASLSITNSQSLLKLMSIESVMPSNNLIFCHPCLLLPSIFPSIRVFSNESVLHLRWPKYWSSSFSINPSNEYSGLISFRMDWLNLLAVQGTLRSLLQHHGLKASILQHSAFFMVQLSHPYLTTGKTTALTIWTFVCKVMSLLFNTLSRFVIAIHPKSKCLLISWLQSPYTLILEPKKMKSDIVSTFSPSMCHEGIRLCAMTLVFWMLSFKPAFSLSSFIFIKRPFSSSSLSASKWILTQKRDWGIFKL